jgi:putative lipoprotein
MNGSVFVAAASFIACSLAAPRARASDDRWFGPDKFLHFGVAAGIAGATYASSSLFLEERWQRAATGASAAIALGAAKELYDLGGAGDASWKDFTWDVAGAAVGVGLALALDLALSGGRQEEPGAQTVALRW